MSFSLKFIFHCGKFLRVGNDNTSRLNFVSSYFIHLTNNDDRGGQKTISTLGKLISHILCDL